MGTDPLCVQCDAPIRWQDIALTLGMCASCFDQMRARTFTLTRAPDPLEIVSAIVSIRSDLPAQLDSR